MIKFLVAALLSISWVHAANKPASVEIKGKQLYSFAPQYALVATKTHIFRINKNRLSASQRDSLQRASVDMRVPYQALDIAWKMDQAESGALRPRPDFGGNWREG